MDNPVTRRHFLERSLGAAAIVSGSHTPKLRHDQLPTANSQLPTGADTGGRRDSRALRLGGPIFSSTDDPEEMARVHRQLGYRAAYCPRPT